MLFIALHLILICLNDLRMSPAYLLICVSLNSDFYQNEADVNATDHDCWSVLHHACFGGHLGCVQLTLSAGVPLHLKDKVDDVSTIQHAPNKTTSIQLSLPAHRTK